ncbi:MAG: hypothetical protein GXP62_18305, partial [Oligoflexia bacterium]|nr:hypothetical protein [Oligoflexia bacterium]
FYLRPRMIAHHLFHIRSVDARQMANGLWSVLPDLPVIARRRVWSRVQRARQ